MRVWNITDDPRRKDIAGVQLMILQKLVKPGAFVTLPDSETGGAKLLEDQKRGLIWIGDQLPAGYLKAKNAKKVVLKEGVKRAHGENAAPTIKLEVTDRGLEVKEERPRWGSSKKNKR